MTAAPAPRPGVPELALLERAAGYTRAALLEAVDADPARPTPCEGWGLADLLHHMLGSVSALEEAGRTRAVRLVAAAGHPQSPASAVPALQERVCALLAPWTAREGDGLVSVAGSPLRAGVLAAAGALEVAVHGWDVAASLGLDHPLPEPLAADLITYLPLLVQPADRGVRFAPAVPVPPGAGAAAVLLGALGRDPGRGLS